MQQLTFTLPYSLTLVESDFLIDTPKCFAVLSLEESIRLIDGITWYLPTNVEIEITRKQYETFQRQRNVELRLGGEVKPFFDSNDTSLSIWLTATPVYFTLDRIRNPPLTSHYGQYMCLDFLMTKYTSIVLMENTTLPKIPSILISDIDDYDSLVFAKVAQTAYELFIKEKPRALLRINLS